MRWRAVLDSRRQQSDTKFDSPVFEASRPACQNRTRVSLQCRRLMAASAGRGGTVREKLKTVKQHGGAGRGKPRQPDGTARRKASPAGPKLAP